MTRHFPRLFWWHVVRDVRRHPLLAALNIASVALGVAVYLAIQIANGSANRAFAASVDFVAGKAHLEVRGPVAEEAWPALAKAPGVKAVTALVEGVATLPAHPGEYLRLVGVDLFSGAPFQTWSFADGGTSFDAERWLGTPGGVALPAPLATRLGVKPGGTLAAVVNGEPRTLTLLATLDPAQMPAGAGERWAVMDLGWAQELLGQAGRLGAIQLLLDEPRRAESVAASLAPLLPPDVRATPPRQRSAQLDTMVAAFQLNLTALSLVSLLVGVFLVYNTISATVTRRRRELGILRAVGATRGEVRALFLGEAVLFGVLGIALGCVGGVALAGVLTAPVAQTISTLYVLVSLEGATASPLHFLTAAGFGLAAVLAGAWVPAEEAARTDPVRALALGTRAEASAAHTGRWAALGVALVAGGALAAWRALAGGSPVWSFVAAFGVLAGASFFAPALVTGFGALAARVRGGVVWRLAAEALRRSIHRNAVTVAALAAAVAMTTGLAVMIGSFRETVDAWIARAIVADVFIAPAANELVGLVTEIPPAAITALRADPEIASVDTYRESSVPAQGRAEALPQPTLVAVVAGTYRGNLQFQGGDDRRRMARVFAGEAVVITEALARKRGVREGEPLRFLTPRGPVELPVAGIYADYSRDQGAVAMSRTTWERHWPEPGVHSLAVYLTPNAKPGAALERFRTAWSRAGEFAIYDNRALRDRVLVVFDQTFAVTAILRTVAILVALAGIGLAVTALVAERERDIGTLRAIGASPGQIAGLFMVEAALMAAVACLLGLASGLALAAVLVHVVNPAFFGWTIALHLPWLALAATPLWLGTAAIAAAWLPARRAARTPIAQAVRNE